MCIGTLEKRLIFLFVCVYISPVFGNDLIDGVVNIKCGTLEENFAELSYFGETSQVAAFTGEGQRCKFKQNVATATWTLNVGLHGSDDERCSMSKLPSRHIYSIQVISFRGSPDFEDDDDEKFLMECNFETYKESQDESLPLVDSELSPHVHETHGGKPSTSNYSIEVIQMEGTSLNSVEIGSIVRLKVEMSPSEEEEGLGFMPVKCEVMTPDFEEGSFILADGCGTGYPFHKEKGFLMDGNIGMSPAFRMFRVHPTKGVVFKCTFVTCNADCTGSTCAAENITESRLRRDVFSTNLLKSLGARRRPRELVDNSKGTKDMEDQANSPTYMVSSRQTKILSSENQPWPPPLGGSVNPADQPSVLLIGQLDGQSFLRTVKLTVIGLCVFVLFVFLAMICFIVVKLRDIK